MKLPPLNAVRAFEAAARHVSFSKAAEELCVTRGAVSRQVALLEDWLGRELFHRSSSQLALTAAGRGYLAEVTSALQRLSLASNYLMEQSAVTTLRLNAPPTFEMRWLISRMLGYIRTFPGVELTLVPFKKPIAFRDNEYDIAIRGATEPLPDCTSVPFMAETVIPVCHPDLLAGKDLMSLDDLSGHTLLSHSAEAYTWIDWLDAVGRPRLKPAGVLKFDEMYFALHAAVEGLGLVLVPLFLVIDELVAERLCAPFGTLGYHRRDYYVSYPHASEEMAAVRGFRQWITKEGRDTDQTIANWIAEKGWQL